MLGVLLAVKGSLHRPHVRAMGSSTGAGQDKHMLLPLAPVVGRIQVLPLSSRPNPQHHKVGKINVEICMIDLLDVSTGYSCAGFSSIIFTIAKNSLFSPPLNCSSLFMLCC